MPRTQRPTKVIEVTLRVRVPTRAPISLVRREITSAWYGSIDLPMSSAERIGRVALFPRWGKARRVSEDEVGG
jgi:hypothetical protein